MKKNRIIFKRTHDFWAGFSLALILFSIALIYLIEVSFEIKIIMSIGLGIFTLFIFYYNFHNRIFNVIAKSFSRKRSYEEFSIAMEYKDLNKLVEEKKELEKKVHDVYVGLNIETNKNLNIRDVWKN